MSSTKALASSFTRFSGRGDGAAADEGGASSMGGSNAGGSWYGSGPMSASQLMQIGRDRKQSTKPATVRVSPNRPKRDVKYIPGTDILMFGVDHLSTTY